METKSPAWREFL
jgi:hypothetical protein